MEPEPCGKLAAVSSVLEVVDARVEFHSPAGTVRALDGVSLSVKESEIVAVVGESGCGKTTLARAVLGLQPLAAGSINRLLAKALVRLAPQQLRMGEIPKDTLKENGYVWVASRKLWVKK